MLAIFQLPNKFFEKDGCVIDLIGHEWGNQVGTRRPLMARAPKKSRRQP